MGWGPMTNAPDLGLTNRLDALPRPAELLELVARTLDARVARLHHLVHVVLVPSAGVIMKGSSIQRGTSLRGKGASDAPWLRIVLRELNLVLGDHIRVAVEDREPRRPARGSDDVLRCAEGKSGGPRKCSESLGGAPIGGRPAPPRYMPTRVLHAYRLQHLAPRAVST